MSDEDAQQLANTLAGDINAAIILLHSIDGERTITKCTECGTTCPSNNNRKLSHAHKAGCRIDILARQVRKLRQQLGLSWNWDNG